MKTNQEKGSDQNVAQNPCLDSQPESKPANILLNAKKDAKRSDQTDYFKIDTSKGIEIEKEFD